MANFTDSEGREWPIIMTVGKAARLKKQFNLDFVAALYDVDIAYKIIGKLCQSLDRFCEVIHTAAGAEIHLDEFMDGLGGEDIAAAFEALDQSFTDFYPPGKREMVARTKANMKASLENEQENIMEELNEKMATEMRRAVRMAAGPILTPGK